MWFQSSIEYAYHHRLSTILLFLIFVLVNAYMTIAVPMTASGYPIFVGTFGGIIGYILASKVY
jgi:hypothetical protein